MKQTNLYYVLVLCLVIISVLITILLMSSDNKYQSQDMDKSRNIKAQYHNYPNHPNYPNYPNYPNHLDYGDVDYSYGYDSYWYQPSRWWNNLWNNRNEHQYYNRHNRNNYDRQDGLNIHNRYNFIQQQPVQQSQPTQQSQPIQQQPIQQSHKSQQPKIDLVKPEFGSDFPFPTLSSSSNSMPEEIAISPMNSMYVENGIHSISRFIGDLPMPFQTTDYNFNYKGPDMKNQKPFPIDMMASESIYLQPNTVANEIIIPPVVMEHPNPM